MAGKYYILAFPDLTEADRAMIDRFRNQYDLPFKDIVAPHFTLVFGVNDADRGDLSRHAERIAKDTHPIEFECRYAMLGADDANDNAHVFLVPDKGFSAISLLHDQLYTGLLSENLRLDLEYIPHITIGTMADRGQAKMLCDQLNMKPHSIAGSIRDLSLVELRNGMVDVISVMPLSG
jgi:2'-5' RNA ligase